VTTAKDSVRESATDWQKIRFEELVTPTAEPGEHFARFEALRDRGHLIPGVAGEAEHPFWVVTRMQDVRACCQDPTIFSNSAISVSAPDPSYLWIPEMLDPPVHTKWRRLLGQFFSPGAIAPWQPRGRAVMNEILDEVIEKGRCDFVADVALRFPNTLFSEMFGLPLGDAPQFQVWETAILHASPDREHDSLQAMREVQDYFAGLIAERRKQPREDILTIALTWTIDGDPVSDDDLLAFCLLVFMAGLDTVGMQLSYAMWHLARHPGDRRRLAADPTLWESAIEEFLRYYAMVTTGRKVMKDTEIGGCPVKAGQMLMLPLSSANRDPAEFPDADKVIIDRKENRHLGFGAGVHRCLGSHLARQQLYVALTEWHKRIPEYSLDPDVRVGEHGGQIGLDNLPLVWETQRP
jgi:cytochrome P450